MMKFPFFFSFGVRHLLFDLPAMPANGFYIDPGCLCLLRLPFNTRYSAGRAGILRFAFEFLPMLALKFFHTSCDSLHPFLAVFVGGGKGDPETAVPVFPECIARDHRHAAVIQKVIGKC
jgi:hypothetical protein